jgi:flagellar biosynthesis protein FlhG
MVAAGRYSERQAGRQANREIRQPMPRIYPIGGGKGGVGKSFVSAGLGALIASRGQKVALIDLDLGASNLHTFLGVPAPEKGLDRYLDKAIQDLESAAVSTHIGNLFFISSCHCSMEIANLFYAQKIKLINAIKKLPFDYVFLDLGAGTNFNTLDFFLTASKGIIVCTPEPTSIENAFRFIKAVYLRRLKQLIKLHPFDPRVKTAVLDQAANTLKAQDIIGLVVRHDPGKVAFLKERIGSFQFKMVLNQYRKNADPTLGDKIKTVCNRHFYSPFEVLGRVDFDERVIDSIYARKLYIKEYPATATALGLKHIADLLTFDQPASAAPQKAP